MKTNSFHYDNIVKAFDHHDLIWNIVYDICGSTESRAGPWGDLKIPSMLKVSVHMMITLRM